MAYTELDELPVTVRGILEPANQRRWMNLYNHFLGQGSCAREAYREAWKTALSWQEVRAVSGKASLDLIDSQGERVNQDTLVREINDTAWNYGLTFNDAHSNHPFGDWLFAEKAVEDGIEINRVYGAGRIGKQFYDVAWRDYILTGNKNGLSVGIMKIAPYTKCEKGRCWRQIDQLQIFEISAVPRGAVPGAALESINFSAKSSEETNMDETKAGPEKEPALPPETADKEEPKGEPEQAAKPAPDAGSLGALAEGMQKLLGMTAEQNARMDRMEAAFAELKASKAPEPPAETAEPPAAPPADKPAEEAPTEKAEDQAPSEPAKDAPPEKGPEEEKADKSDCPKKFADKAKELVDANKEGRKEATEHGAKANRPEQVLDGLAASQGQKETMEQRMQRYAGMSTAELDAEAERLTRVGA